MHSNFITPPDYVESVLIIGASDEEIQACAEATINADHSFNVYVYREEMNDRDWVNRIMFRVDTILLQEDQLQFTVPRPIGFGPSCELKNPQEYFINKQ